MTSKEIRRIKKTLDTLETGFVKRAQQLFDTIIPEMQPYVEDTLRTGNVDGFELPGRKRYLVLYKRFLQELYAQGMTIADLELEAKRAKFDQHPSPAPIIPTEAMDWIDGWTTRWGDDYYGDATQDVVRVLKQGLAEGWSTEHTMSELRTYLGVTTEHGFNDRRLRVIARTNATSAFNQGRLETFRQAGDFVKYVQFLAILDSRTTDICESRHGRLLRLDSPELAANTPPLHFQCRSVFSPVTAYDLKDMEKPGWKDDQGRTLAELQDWSNVDAPAKGFGGGSGPGKPPTQTGGSGGEKRQTGPSGGFSDDIKKVEIEQERRYNRIRENDNDTKEIALHTGISEDIVKVAKEHVFIKEHSDEHGNLKRFDPDEDMASAWERMTSGSQWESDHLLVMHEYIESKLMYEEGMTYKIAHDKANELYNWYRENIREKKIKWDSQLSK